MNSIAIACHPVDIVFARKVARDLQNAGAYTWIRVDNLQTNGDWRTAMMVALKSADLMLLVLSPEAMRDEQVTEEWERYLRLSKPLVPLYWRECEPNYKLTRLQYVDFRREKIAYDRAFNHLLVELAQNHRSRVDLEKPHDTQSVATRMVGEIIQEQTGMFPAVPPPEEGGNQWLIGVSLLIVIAAVLISLAILFYGA